MKTYGALSLEEDGSVWLIQGLAPHVAIRLKHIFPKISKTQTDLFRFPNENSVCADLDWFITRYPLAISDKDRRALTKRRKKYELNQAELEEILRPEFKPSIFAGLREGCTIRHYQAQAIELAYRTKCLLLGDDVGLGKTYTAAGMMLMPGCLPCIVVVEPHLQEQWKVKLEGQTNLRVHCVEGTKPYDLPEADVYIQKYSCLAGWIDTFHDGFFKLAVWDEIQSLRRGTDSEKGKASEVLARNSTWLLGLSATPIHNFGIEIHNLFSILKPGVLGTREEFLREWGADDKQIKDPVALGSYLREQNIFMRRLKSDVGQQLPVVNTIIEDVAHDAKALRSIEEFARALAIRYEHGSFTEKGQAGRELDMLVRQATGVSKASFIAQYAKIFLESGTPIVMAGWHRAVYDIWLRELAQYKPAMYTGSENPKQKLEQKRRFMEGETNCFIMSLHSGAGLDDLQLRCSTLIHGELDWSPKVHEQLTGRLDREGQTQPVLSIYMIGSDGSDPPIVELLGLKASQSAGIVDPGRVFEATQSDNSRVRLLVDLYRQNTKAAA